MTETTTPQQDLELHIHSKESAEKVLASNKPLTHLVSIGSPGGKPPRGFKQFTGAKLRLEFDDITQASGWSAVFAGYQAAQPSDAKMLCDFYRQIVLPHPAPRVLIHCAQGISRSAAAGLTLLFMHLHDGVRAAEVFYALGTEFRPNALFIALLDGELGARAQLIRAAGIYTLMQDNDEATIERRRDEYAG